ncbi:unnamed protein product [Dovyalis caffra]|uniref:KAT8 regulatory NSL complex subunit 2 n=1 Tax=Dovyalis caffra TaxID=77055 RepID=A0AAV1QLM1_9ROSI|nr:unnamed protein product [Dovyalis caffra]
MFIVEFAEPGVSPNCTGSCGNRGLDIRFPFWIKDRQPDQCGYPGFGLSCNERDEIVLELPTAVKLYIEKIDYKNQVIYASDPQDCLLTRNSNFNISVFHLQFKKSKGNFSFFNCASNKARSQNRIIPCLSTLQYNIPAINSERLIGIDDELLSCTKMYDLPFPHDIRLSWSNPKCGSCEAKRKLCRLRKNSSTELETECYGMDKPNKDAWKKRLTIGVITGFFLFGILVIAVYQIYSFNKAEKEYEAKVERKLEYLVFFNETVIHAVKCKLPVVCDCPFSIETFCEQFVEVKNKTNPSLSTFSLAAMTAATKNHHASSSKPPKNLHSTPNTATSTTPQTNTTQNPNPSTTNTTTPKPSPLSPSLKDQVLSRATHITRQELLKRRSHKLKQLSSCFKDHYWALMEDLKVQYREYYWKYGVSPFKEDHPSSLQKQEQQKQDGVVGVLERENGEREANVEVIGEDNNNATDLKINRRCLFVGCKLKAMALTSFCHLHILSDAKQKLYKPCNYVIKRFDLALLFSLIFDCVGGVKVSILARFWNRFSVRDLEVRVMNHEGFIRFLWFAMFSSAQAGPITCGKPILRSTAPSLCTVHFQKAQKHVTQALRKAGLNVSSSSKLAPKFHVIVTEYVRQIQAKRKSAKGGDRSEIMDKELLKLVYIMQGRLMLGVNVVLFRQLSNMPLKYTAIAGLARPELQWLDSVHALQMPGSAASEVLEPDRSILLSVNVRF